MRIRILLFSCLFLPMCISQVTGQNKTVAERLGYPADSKLLIVHADDLAVAHSVDSASFDALEKNAITSASVMMPCPWVSEVAAFARAHPDADIGLHLTLTSEWKTYRWGPVAPADKVPSLLDPAGTFWNDSPLVGQHAKPEDAEREMRAQVERALALGIHPTHLDTHMGSAFSTPDMFAIYAKVAHDYHLPFLVIRVPGAGDGIQSALSAKDVVLDSIVIAGEGQRADQWRDFYLNAIKGLKPGLTEMIVHLGHDDAELQAITVDHVDYGSAWRQRDYDFISGPEFKKSLQDSQVILVKWKDLQKLENQQ